MIIDVFNYLNQKILYVPEINYYFNVSDVEYLEPGEYKIQQDELLHFIRKFCPDESKVFFKIPYTERLEKMKFSLSETMEESKTAQHTLCLHPSRNCNLKCKYCFGQDEYLETSSLSMQVAKDSIDFLVDTYAPSSVHYVVDLSGSGEPLLNFELIKNIIEYCDKKRSIIGKSVGVMFATNATLLNNRIVDYLDNESVSVIGVSIDGDQISNDQNRVYKDGKGTYEDILRGIKLFKNKKVGMAVTITPLNQNVDQIYDHLYHLDNVDCVSMKFLRKFDGSSYDFDNFDVPYLISRYEKLCNQIFKELENDNFNYLKKLIQGADYFGNLITQTLFKGLNKFYRCDAGKTRIAVNSKGDIYACSVMVGDPKFKLGNIYTGIDEQKQNIFRTPVTKSVQKCINCHVRSACGGECYVNSYLKYNDLHKPLDKMCEITTELNKLSMAFLEKLRTDYPKMYKTFLDFSFKVQGYDVTDSAIWAVLTYFKYKGIQISYSTVLEKLEFTNKGVQPNCILEFVKNYVKEADAYIIESTENIREMSFPAIGIINRQKSLTFNYIVILEQKENRIVFQTSELNAQSVYEVPIEEFLSELSNILIL